VKILIALDDSAHSERAVQFVTGMRWPAGSRVIVVTVMRSDPTIRSSSGKSAGAKPSDHCAELELHCEAVVTRAQDRLRESGMSTEGRIVEGDPREQLLRLIETERADLLAMGSRGRTGIVQLLLGSVSSQAVGHAACSVLVVKRAPNCAASRATSNMVRPHHGAVSKGSVATLDAGAETVDDGVRQERKDEAMKILIGIDDSPHSKAAVDFVRRLVWPKNTKVVVTSVIQPVVPAYTEMYVPTAYPVDLQEELIRAHQEMLSSAAASLRARGLGTEVKVLLGDPRIALVEAAHSERADLMVVGSHGRTGIARLFMGSVAQHVVTHAPCSVLVVKVETK